jgi:nucleoid DNA-binding protein
MTRKEIVAKSQEVISTIMEGKVNLKQTEAILDGVIGVYIDDVVDNGKTVIKQLGTLTMKDIAERSGKVPGTDKQYVTEAHRSIKLKLNAAGRQLGN